MNILIIGNIGSGKSSIVDSLCSMRPEFKAHKIDDYRVAHSDGTLSGELFAWAHFLKAIQGAGESGIYEFSGTGKNAWPVREAMKHSKRAWCVVLCRCCKETLAQRNMGRHLNIPFPYAGFDDASTAQKIDAELDAKVRDKFWGFRIVEVNTDCFSPEVSAGRILREVLL